MKRKIFFITVFSLFVFSFFTQITLAARNVSATISPATAFVGEDLTYTYIVTNINDGSTTAGIGSAEIQLPTGFETPSSINILSTSANKTWVLGSSNGYGNGFNSSTKKIGIKANAGTDKLDVNESVEIQITTIAPTSPNTYQWTASVWANLDFSGTPPFALAYQPTVDVVLFTDTTPPIITLAGSNTINLNVGDAYTELGATATDDVDGDLTSSIVIDNPVDVNTAGTYTITYDVLDSAGNHAIQIIRTVIVSVVSSIPDSVTINLKIYAGDAVLFDEPKTVTACAESPEVGAPITVNAKCAIEQSGLSNTWTWYDSNLSTISELPKTLGVLDELGGNSSDNMDYIYWGWFSNLNYGSTALNKHTFVNGEELLLTYNSYPLRISASKTSGKVGDTIIFTTEGKNTFNEDWTDMIWTSLSGVTITLGTQSCTTITDGTCSIVLDITGSLNAIGSKSLYVPSNNIGIEVSNNNSGGGGNPPVIHHKVDIDKALQYLSEKQNSDGSFSSDLYTDWVAIAAEAGDNSNLKSSITSYLKNNPFDSSVATDNERHAMALMALGIDPYSGTNVNYIKKITDSFNGEYIGEESLINDDIFALIVLANAGYSSSDEIISKDVKYLLDPSIQPLDGNWGSVDMTAALIQALKPFDNVNGVSDAISNAENYLIESQNEDGGFNNSSSTSWALQALSLNSSFDAKVNNGIEYLAEHQQDDGGLEGSDMNTRIWATSYAIPAVMGKSWGDIMQSFQKPVTQNNSSDGILENTDLQKPDNHVFCPKGDLFSTITGESCTDVTETNVASINIPTLVQDQNLIKKVVNKKNIETPKIKKVINPEEIQNSLNQDQEISAENNLGASAGNATSVKISLKKIPQTVIHVVVNTLAYIGKSFYDLIIFLRGSIGAVFG